MFTVSFGDNSAMKERVLQQATDNLEVNGACGLLLRCLDLQVGLNEKAQPSSSFLYCPRDMAQALLAGLSCHYNFARPEFRFVYSFTHHPGLHSLSILGPECSRVGRALATRDPCFHLGTFC